MDTCCASPIIHVCRIWPRAKELTRSCWTCLPCIFVMKTYRRIRTWPQRTVSRWLCDYTRKLVLCLYSTNSFPLTHLGCLRRRSWVMANIDLWSVLSSQSEMTLLDFTLPSELRKWKEQGTSTTKTKHNLWLTQFSPAFWLSMRVAPIEGRGRSCQAKSIVTLANVGSAPTLAASTLWHWADNSPSPCHHSQSETESRNQAQSESRDEAQSTLKPT